MPESRETRLMRWKFKFFPALWCTGAKITYIAGDYKEVRLKVPLKLRTRNYVGSMYGGSMYGAVDGIYMVMLIKLLGRGYVVWDKTAFIRFRKPARSTLYATFKIDDAELEAIREVTQDGEPVDRVYNVDLVDAEGVVHASVEKTIYVRRVTQKA